MAKGLMAVSILLLGMLVIAHGMFALFRYSYGKHSALCMGSSPTIRSKRGMGQALQP